MFPWKKRPTAQDFFDETSEEAIGCILRVRRFICHMVGDPYTAEDLTQEVMMQAIRKWDQRKQDEVLPWVITIAKHHTLDYLRKNKAREKKAPFVELTEEHIDSSYSRTEDQMVDKVILNTAMSLLSFDERELVALRLAGLTNREIACIRGVSEEKARQDVLKALRAIQANLVLEPTSVEV